MATQSTMDVSKWQAARPQWAYTPALWFFYRMIEVAYLDARSCDAAGPTDEALLARDWIARSEKQEQGSRSVDKPQFVSFPECCEVLGLIAEDERTALLEAIDKVTDTDNDDAWARLAELSSRDAVDDVEPLFDAPRIVPALDQISLFSKVCE